MLIHAFGRTVDARTGRAPGSVACPSCGAQRDKPCVTPKGRPAKALHLGRVELAAKLSGATP